MSSSSDQLDLHGLTFAEALDRFVEQYNVRVKRGQLGCWTIFHGYGSTGEGGVIRSKLRAFLARHSDQLCFEPGDNYGNPGWTWVYPKDRLPDKRERLALEILEFCTDPKAEEKILREFVGSGVQAKEILRSLLGQGRLTTVGVGSKMKYQTAAIQ